MAQTVLAMPNYNIVYETGITTINDVAALSINAFADSSNQPHNLVVGASANVEIEANQSTNVTFSDQGSLSLYNFANGDYVNKYKILNINNDSTTTTINAPQMRLDLQGSDPKVTTGLSLTSFYIDNDFQKIATSMDGFMFEDYVFLNSNLVVNSDIIGHQNLAVGGNMFSRTMNLYKNLDAQNDTELSQVAYAFFINTNNQLELIRYEKYGISNISTRQTRVNLWGDGSNRSIAGIYNFGQSNYTVLNQFSGLSSIGNVNSNGFMTGSSGGQNIFKTDDSNIYLLESNVGIGTALPQVPLDVNGAIRATTYCNLFLDDLTSTSIYHAPTTSNLSYVWENVSYLSNSLIPKSIFSSNLTVALSNAIFSGAVGGGAGSTSNDPGTYLMAFATSNDLYPNVSYIISLGQSLSNAVYSGELSARDLYSSNLATTTSNNLYPRTQYACNLSITLSNTLYSKSTFSSNTATFSSNKSIFASNLAITLSNVVYSGAVGGSSSTDAIFASNTVIPTSNLLYGEVSARSTFASNTSVFASNMLVNYVPKSGGSIIGELNILSSASNPVATFFNSNSDPKVTIGTSTNSNMYLEYKSENYGKIGIKDGSTAITITPSNVGIGTDAPDEALDIVGSVLISSNLQVGGNLTVLGTTQSLQVNSINLDDNMITLNNGASYDVNMEAGLEISRGSNYSSYYFVFDESTQQFRLGEQGALQAVATREDSPSDDSVPFYDQATDKYISSTSFVYASNKLGVNKSSPVYTLDVGGVARVETLSTSDASIVDSEGLWLSYNRADDGANYYLNQKGTSSGGHVFGEVDASNVFTKQMSLTSGKLQVTGTVLGNSFAFTSESNTGVYNQSNAQLSIDIQGSTKLLATSNGVHVYGNLTTSNLILGSSTYTSASLSTWSNAAFYASNTSVSACNLAVDSSNTLYPSAIFSSNKSSWASNSYGTAVRVTGSTMSGNLTIISSNVITPPAFAISNNATKVDFGLAIQASQFSSSAASNDLVIRNSHTQGRIHLQQGSNAAAVTINSNNRVGVGIATPLEALHIVGKTYTTQQVLGDSNATAVVPAFSFRQSSNMGMYAASSNTLGFATVGVQRLTIDESGVCQAYSMRSIKDSYTNFSTIGRAFTSGEPNTWMKLAIISGFGVNTRSWGIQFEGIISPTFSGTTSFDVRMSGSGPGLPSIKMAVKGENSGNFLTSSGFDIRGLWDSNGLLHLYGVQNYGASRVGIALNGRSTGYSLNGPIRFIENQVFSPSNGYFATSNDLIAVDPSLSNNVTQMFSVNSNATYEQFTIGTNTGFNTSNPVEALHVVGKMYSTSQILADSNDSSNAPAFSFMGDSNTGISHPIDNELAIVTAGSEKIRISSSNINMNAPLYLPDTGQQIMLSFGNPNSNTHHVTFMRSNNGLQLRAYDRICLLPGSAFSSNNATSEGFVGINTGAPFAPLHVYSSNSTLLYLQNPTSGFGNTTAVDFSTYYIGSNTSNNTSVRIAAVDHQYSAHLLFSTKQPGSSSNSLIERMRIANNGLVGIGTSSPVEELHVSGKIYSTNQILVDSNDSSNAPAFSFMGDSNTGICHPSNDTLGFVTAGVDRVRIDSQGFMGIGVSSPTVALDVNGSGKFASNVVSQSTGTIGVQYSLNTGFFDLVDTSNIYGFAEPGNPGVNASMFHQGFFNGSNCSGEKMSWTQARLMIRGCSLGTSSNATNVSLNICCYNSNTNSNSVLTTITCTDYGTQRGYCTNFSPFFALSNIEMPYLGIQLATSNTTFRVGPTSIFFSA